MALELTVVTGSTGKHGGSVAQGFLERSHKKEYGSESPGFQR